MSQLHNSQRLHPRPAANPFAVIANLPQAMAGTVSRPSQAKISDSFRSTSKSSKPVKHKKPEPKNPSPAFPRSAEPGTPSLQNDPELLSAARNIESKRKTPFGSIT